MATERHSSPPKYVVLDDRLLIEELLIGTKRGRKPVLLATTKYWYYRACRAAVAGAGGHLSGPFAQVDAHYQARAIQSLLELRLDITLPDARETVPLMATIAQRHPRLNVLNLEAVATAIHLNATVWLSLESAAGVLPDVLDWESIAWVTVPIP